MPLYDFKCKACENTFEGLVRTGSEPTCPRCRGAELERLPSLPFAKTDGTRAQAMRAAQRRDAAQAKDRAHEQRKYELSHDD
jgi:putative FmdB family regulatory protein